jgi:hypothetical protein
MAQMQKLPRLVRVLSGQVLTVEWFIGFQGLQIATRPVGGRAAVALAHDLLQQLHGAVLARGTELLNPRDPRKRQPSAPRRFGLRPRALDDQGQFLAQDREDLGGHRLGPGLVDHAADVGVFGRGGELLFRDPAGRQRGEVPDDVSVLGDRLPIGPLPELRVGREKTIVGLDLELAVDDDDLPVLRR